MDGRVGKRKEDGKAVGRAVRRRGARRDIALAFMVEAEIKGRIHLVLHTQP